MAGWQSAYQQEQARAAGTTGAANTNMEGKGKRNGRGNETQNTPYGGGSQTSYGEGAYGQSQNSPYGGAYDYSTPGSGQWWGSLNDQGVRDAAASDDYAFDEYARVNYGLESGSNTAAWMGETYNPYALADAFGNSSSNFSDRMGQASAMANIISQPGYQEFDPGRVVASVLQQVAAAGKGASNGPIALIGNGTPAQQREALLGFLDQALSGIMPEESKQAYMLYLSRETMKVVSSANNQNMENFEKGGGNIASKLLAVLGPTGGL